MSILSVRGVSHGFGNRTIFKDVNFRLLKGEHVGLIGANGEGKSTFFNLIIGSIEPDEGQIQWSNRVRVGYLDQHARLDPETSVRDTLRGAFDYLYSYETDIIDIADQLAHVTEEQMNELLMEMGTLQDLLDHHGFYQLDVKVETVARGLGLQEIGLDRLVSELSGGQRSKVLLAKLLLEEPEILLLDEPTNYLDEEHIVWLKDFLQNYDNAFILISHDVQFLNDITNLIYHVEGAEMTRYVGNYDDFLAAYDLKIRQREQAYEKQQQEIAHLEDFIARNKARIATANMAKSRQKKLDKMEKISLQAEKPKPEFHFKKARTPGPIIFKTEDLIIGYDKALTKPLNLQMDRSQKIAIVGANGLGKTTLIKSLLGLIEPFQGTAQRGDHLFIGYFAQELPEPDNKTCIDHFWEEFPGFTQFEVRSALAKCGLLTNQIESQVRVLSGGEQAKVKLAKLVNHESNLLVLDEPTNHLDQDAKEALKKALIDYTGSILMVSHDPEFYKDIVTDIWDAKQWK